MNHQIIEFNGIRVYVAAAYSVGTGDFGVDGNVHLAMKAWHDLTDLGYVAYCPHINLLLGLLEPRRYQVWLDFDKHWMKLCHVMLRLTHGVSKGADDEEAEFSGPIFYSIEELEEWRKSGGFHGETVKPTFDPQLDVVNFHQMIGQPAPDNPDNLDEETVALRMRLIREETSELLCALATGNLPQVGQECVDLLYVVIGTMVSAGLDLPPLWRMVHEANMAKEPDERGGKAVKPEGWIPPDFAREITRQEGTLTCSDDSTSS